MTVELTAVPLTGEAFGRFGDVIDVDFAGIAEEQVVAQMAREVDAIDVERRTLHEVRLIVDEAAVSLPQLSGWLTEQGIEITQAEEFLPPFDDVGGE